MWIQIRGGDPSILWDGVFFNVFTISSGKNSWILMKEIRHIERTHVYECEKFGAAWLNLWGLLGLGGGIRSTVCHWSQCVSVWWRVKKWLRVKSFTKLSFQETVISSIYTAQDNANILRKGHWPISVCTLSLYEWVLHVEHAHWLSNTGKSEQQPSAHCVLRWESHENTGEDW